MIHARGLIVALDFETERDAQQLIDQLNPKLCALKVGNELFTRLGPQFITSLVNQDFRVFLDLKFHDIPNTVAKACKAAADLGVWMLNVHTSGGMKMMDAAREAIDSFGTTKPWLIGVTVLTSFGISDLNEVGISNAIDEQVSSLSLLAKQAGLDGVVCSAYEVERIKALCGADFLTVTPGIRLASDEKHDQTRVMTPQQAINAGSNYLVMGRAITQAAHPTDVIRSVLKSLRN
jgi:orotidine-5'-phosphate decarboxylase